MEPLTKKIYAANMKRYQTAPNPLRSHGPDHHLRVYQYALALAEKSAVAYDKDVLTAAALLHDMATYYPEKTGEQYHDYDHQIAAEILSEVGFPEEKTAAVLFAIAHHGSDAKYQSKPEPVEVTLLRDADKLDAFGSIGVARIIMVRTLKGDTLQEIVEEFYTNGHLERKWHSITSDIAKEMAWPGYQYAKDFFAQLGLSLGSSV